jgi:acyl dehydratase
VKWEQIAVGLELKPWVDRAISRTDIVRYQGASGDFDAAHHDDAHARSFGYEGVFSLGLLHAGILSGFAIRHFGVDTIRRFKVRFKDVIALGEVLTYRGKIIKKYEEGTSRFADVELVCEHENGKPAVQGEATFQLA